VGFASPTVRLTEDQYRTIVGHSFDGLPNEACGLLIGPVANWEPTGVVSEARPCRNEEQSALTYRVGKRDYDDADRAAQERGEEIVGSWHSHTHTDAYPSRTDVEDAGLLRNWVFVIVSLRDSDPVLRAYRIRDGEIAECQVVLS
jgi:[CysO sulfur-carrier protein]-S-L-cysteine hydrolase